MQKNALIEVKSKVSDLAFARPVGRVSALDGHSLKVSGLQTEVKLADRLKLKRRDGSFVLGEVLRIDQGTVTMLPDGSCDQVAIDDPVTSLGPNFIAPSDAWLGRIIDPYGAPLDGHPLPTGPYWMPLRNDPPPPFSRKPFGARLNTGFHLLNTLLPIVRGQRVGIFAGSGVGKSTLLADLLRQLDADIAVLALVGERGREIAEFTNNVLGEAGMVRSVVVAATADAAATTRMHCPQTAMRIAEHFRDQGKHVLLVVDSLTRFAEAQREAAIAGGEIPSFRGFPASTPPSIARLVERAGPGSARSGDITAVFSVLVAGADMDEPIADMLRGVLDAHIVLDRTLAERGQFPAVDVLKSLSRALPDSADDAENKLIAAARVHFSIYQASSALIGAGLYSDGSDPKIDQAIAFQKVFQEFCAQTDAKSVQASFDALKLCLRRASGTA